MFLFNQPKYLLDKETRLIRFGLEVIKGLPSTEGTSSRSEEQKQKSQTNFEKKKEQSNKRKEEEKKENLNDRIRLSKIEKQFSDIDREKLLKQIQNVTKGLDGLEKDFFQKLQQGLESAGIISLQVKGLKHRGGVEVTINNKETGQLILKFLRRYDESIEMVKWGQE